MTSGVIKSADFLKRHHKIGFDNNILIALVEGNPTYGKKVLETFEQIEITGNEVWTSVITIPEVLIHPLRQNLYDIANLYESKFEEPDLHIAEINLLTSRYASRLGARYKLDTKDALILASLIEVGVTGFITADKDFERVKEIDVLIIG